ncbi:hypothetical membrane protein, conserved [Thermococcus kodakarensis KOD1]|uniref:Hypothetical membrane protein, conserved n=1 Tax=Thermococcus kodakarensis (strain ATCC BAA-918 / JCM 12380 / KOD1) TaxID=69014 RepID=Q5JEK5_THEKO|nr:hypothetical protein [Thermococcus kodakarensis]WCN27749.1 hypothetical protein POG15_09395 [Thermococcus kodakarensis]WCN30042.1 hypothetical protein POG21_09380 [Thermococcus kodakarensis]BAD86033.1 hypothetical membrane protein, conserved [Thermococcus kodakarensis KOD1]
MIRRLYLAALFTIITYITYLGFDSRVTLVLSLALSLSILVWWMGYAYLALLGIALVYHRLGGFYGLTLLSLGIIFVESLHLTRVGASMRHYGTLTAAVIMALPLYSVAYYLSAYLPSLVNTMVAALFVVSLYLLFYLVVRR